MCLQHFGSVDTQTTRDPENMHHGMDLSQKEIGITYVGFGSDFLSLVAIPVWVPSGVGSFLGNLTTLGSVL